MAEKISPVTQTLAAGANPSPEDLDRFALDRETRKVLHDALAHHGKLHLFPREHLTWTAMAETDLVAWLCHPNERGCAPDKIELTTSVPAPAPGETGLQYFVFRYRTRPPHWAAKDGWMAGIAGPYAVGGVPAPRAAGTFSRFEAYDSRAPEEHVRITHQLVMERRG